MLLKDLSARLPYGVKVRYSSTKEFITCKLHSTNPIYKIVDLWNEKACFNSVHISKIKPYLFPMSSMTDEQKDELLLIVCELNDSDEWRYGHIIYIDDAYQMDKLLDFYHKNHLDYRGLIEKGLAIDATGLNIY